MENLKTFDTYLLETDLSSYFNSRSWVGKNHLGKNSTLIKFIATKFNLSDKDYEINKGVTRKNYDGSLDVSSGSGPASTMVIKKKFNKKYDGHPAFVLGTEGSKSYIVVKKGSTVDSYYYMYVDSSDVK